GVPGDTRSLAAFAPRPVRRGGRPARVLGFRFRDERPLDLPSRGVVEFHHRTSSIPTATHGDTMPTPSWLRSVAKTLGLVPQSPARAPRRAARGRRKAARTLGRVEELEARWQPSASVWTDKLDYAPGETVFVTGSDFQVG